MKKIIMIMFAGFISVAHANPPDLCAEEETVGHCAYVTGLNIYDTHGGRYIKVSDPDRNYTQVTCTADNYMPMWIHAKVELEYYYKYDLRNRTTHFYICTDITGSNCELIGTDKFTTIKNQDTYISEPFYYEVNLTLVKDKYPACNKWHS